MRFLHVVEKVSNDINKRFQCGYNGRILCVDSYGELNWEDADKDEHLIIDEDVLHSYTFNELSPPIDFKEALSQWLAGMGVECQIKRDGYTEVFTYDRTQSQGASLEDQYGNGVTDEQINEGVWSRL